MKRQNKLGKREEKVEIRWDSKKKIFREADTGLEVKIIEVLSSRTYVADGSDSKPYAEGFYAYLSRVLARSGANAYQIISQSKLREEEYRPTYSTTFMIYKTERRLEKHGNRN